MCCYTHQEPDAAGGQVAGHESLRCRCGTGGGQCIRQATEEDMLCARCREPEPSPPASPGPYDGDIDWYAAGRAGELEFRPPLRYERVLVEDYRLGLYVAQPSPVIITGIG
jgi:hypothetical protein